MVILEAFCLESTGIFISENQLNEENARGWPADMLFGIKYNTKLNKN